MVGVLVNEAEEMPDFEGRPARKVVLNTPPGELTSAHVGARIERFRANGVKYLVVPANVYPWLDRHPELRRFLRTQFRRIEGDDGTCHVYALDSRDGAGAATGTDGLPVPPAEMVALVAGWIEPQEVRALRQVRGDLDRRDAGAQRRGAARARHGPRLRLRLRPCDPALAAAHGRPAARVRTTTRTSCGGARRTCRSATSA